MEPIFGNTLFETGDYYCPGEYLTVISGGL